MNPLLARLLRSTERYTRTDMTYLASAGFWLNLSTISVSLFSLALYLVFANFVSKETFGTYQYLLSIGVILSVLTFTGLNTAVTSAVARGEEGALVRAVRVQLRYSFVPMLAAAAISAYYFLSGNIVLGAGVLIVGIGMPLINTWNTYNAFLFGKQDFKRIFLFGLGINIPFYLLLSAAAFVTESPVVLLAVYFGVQAAGYFIAYRATLATYRPAETADNGVLKYGTHLSVMGALGVIALQIDSILAFHYLGAAGLAIYTFAVAIPERLSGLFKFLPSAALSKFSSRPFAEAREGLLRRFAIILPFLFALAGVYVLTAPLLFSFLFPAYAAAVPYSQWYSLFIFSILTQLLISLLSAHKLVRELYVFNIASPLLQLALQAAGVILFGIAGLVIGRLIGFLTAFVLGLILVVRAKTIAP